MVAQLFRNQQVVGSNPMRSFYAGIVQGRVRVICNHLILSSNQSIGLAGEWNGVKAIMILLLMWGFGIIWYVGN